MEIPSLLPPLAAAAPVSCRAETAATVLAKLCVADARCAIPAMARSIGVNPTRGYQQARTSTDNLNNVP